MPSNPLQILLRAKINEGTHAPWVPQLIGDVLSLTNRKIAAPLAANGYRGMQAYREGQGEPDPDLASARHAQEGVPFLGPLTRVVNSPLTQIAVNQSHIPILQRLLDDSRAIVDSPTGVGGAGLGAIRLASDQHLGPLTAWAQLTRENTEKYEKDANPETKMALESLYDPMTYLGEGEIGQGYRAADALRASPLLGHRLLGAALHGGTRLYDDYFHTQQLIPRGLGTTTIESMAKRDLPQAIQYLLGGKVMDKAAEIASEEEARLKALESVKQAANPVAKRVLGKPLLEAPPVPAPEEATKPLAEVAEKPPAPSVGEGKLDMQELIRDISEAKKARQAEWEDIRRELQDGLRKKKGSPRLPPKSPKVPPPTP